MSPDELNIGADSTDPLSPPPLMPPPRKSAPPKAQNFLRENAILLGLFGVGIAVVYALSLRGGPATASAEQMAAESQVDSAITSIANKNGGVSSKNGKAIIEGFNAKQRQIPIEKLKGNPFVFKSPPPAQVAASRPMITPTPTPVDTELISAKAALKQMKLQSVLSGSNGRPLALITNNLLAEGQTLFGWTVSKINIKDVVITWRDQKQVLALQD